MASHLMKTQQEIPRIPIVKQIKLATLHILQYLRSHDQKVSWLFHCRTKISSAIAGLTITLYYCSDMINL